MTRKTAITIWLIGLGVSAVAWLTSCDAIVDEQAVIDQCRAYIDEQYQLVRDDAWLACTSFYEDVVIPHLDAISQWTVLEVKKELEEQLQACQSINLRETLVYNGCLPVVGAAGNILYDCVGTVVCSNIVCE